MDSLTTNYRKGSTLTKEYLYILKSIETYDIVSSSSSLDMSLSCTSESSRASNADCRSDMRLKASLRSCCNASLVLCNLEISALNDY